MQLLIPCALAAVATAGLGLYARSMGEKLGVMDWPDAERKSHGRATPAVGGIILAVVGTVFSVAVAPFSSFGSSEHHLRGIAVLTAVLCAMLIGFWDDRAHIAALKRLLIGLAISGVLLLLIPDLQLKRIALPSIGLVLETGILAVPISILCLLALKHAVNMADGRNGLLLGLSLIWTVFFIAHSPPPALPWLAALLGILVVLFGLNCAGRLFMGDCGAYGIATGFGIMALAYHQNAQGNVGTAEVILLFLIPVLDTIRLIFVRIRAGVSPMAPDDKHLHHLLDKALGWKRGWFVYMALVAAPLTLNHLHPGAGAQILLFTIIAYSLVIARCRTRIPVIRAALEPPRTKLSG